MVDWWARKTAEQMVELLGPLTAERTVVTRAVQMVDCLVILSAAHSVVHSVVRKVGQWANYWAALSVALSGGTMAVRLE